MDKNMSDLAAEIAARLQAATSATPQAPQAPMMMQPQVQPTFTSMQPMPAMQQVPAMQMMPAGQMMQQAPAPVGVALRMVIPLPDGSELSAYLLFGPEAANPQVIAQLAGVYPLATYRPRQQQQGWGNGGGGGGYGQGQGQQGQGGYNRGYGGGGYNRGGYGNGRRW